jgi:hypothetical protein
VAARLTLPVKGGIHPDMALRTPQVKSRSLYLVATALAVLVAVPRCTGFRREGGIFDQARARDVYASEISKRCPMPYENWEKYCLAPYNAEIPPERSKCPIDCQLDPNR